MNIIIFLIAFICLGQIIAKPLATIITGINLPLGAVAQVGKIDITFAITANSFAGSPVVSKIHLSTSETTVTTGTVITHEVKTPPVLDANTYAASFQVTEIGRYYVHVEDSDGTTPQVSGSKKISIEVNATPDPTPQAPADNLITAISSTDPVANITVNFTFTLATDGLQVNDKIYLSKADTLGANDVSVTLDKAATSSIVKEFKLTDKGSYSAFVKRGDLSTKQTAKAIVVDSSDFISFAFVLILTLFLF